MKNNNFKKIYLTDKNTSLSIIVKYERVKFKIYLELSNIIYLIYNIYNISLILTTISCDKI